MNTAGKTTPARCELCCDRTSDDTLLVRLAGSGKIQVGLPAATEVQQLDITPRVRRLAFDTHDLTAWDSGLLTFLRQVLAQSTQRQIGVDPRGLPEGVQHLLTLAAAIPERHPPIELLLAEQAIIKRIHRAKLFVFLRQHRHVLFPAAFQHELATLYKDKAQGPPPVLPAQLALATIMQASSGVSDDEVIEATTMDRRWPLVLNRLDGETPPFSKGTLVTSCSARLDFAEFEQWASLLQDSVTHVVAKNLSLLIPTDRVALHPWPRTTPVDYQVSIAVDRFDGAAGGEVVLLGYWSLWDADGNKLVRRKVRFSAPTGGSEYEALVSAMSRTLSALSQDIVAAVQSVAQQASTR